MYFYLNHGLFKLSLSFVKTSTTYTKFTGNKAYNVYIFRHDHCDSLPGRGPVEKSGARHSRRHPHPYEQHFRSANKDV